MKCDEAKPACLRCIKFGTVCDGYASKKPAKAPHTSPVKKIPIKLITPKAVVPKTILKTPERNPFANDQEYGYFSLFCAQTASTLAGYFRGSLWNRIVLQACEDMPPIRHAIIALGALDKTLDITQRTDGLGSPDLRQKVLESAAHHRFALQQYGKAIAQMRKILSALKQDYRAALILCLLTICFEALNGDMQSALEQIRNGLKLIKEWRLSNKSTPELGFSPETQSLDNYELMRAFSFLDNNSIMIINAEPVGSSSEMGTDGEDIDWQIPNIYPDLEEARAQFEVLVSRMLHWVASAYAWGAREKDEAKRRVQPSPGLRGEGTKPKDFQHILNEQRQKHLQDFRNWHSAFQPLWDIAQSINNHKQFMTALTLEMRFKAIFTSSLLGDHFKGDTVYDALTTEFREIVDLGKLFVKHEKLERGSQRATFTFDDPFISAIYNVILKCRDPILRREAIALLESHHRRDGVMDSAMMAKIGRLQMNIEEDGSEGNYIPEHARIRGIKTTTDMVRRTGQMKYLKMASSSNREFVVHHVNFTW